MGFQEPDKTQAFKLNHNLSPMECLREGSQKCTPCDTILIQFRSRREESQGPEVRKAVNPAGVRGGGGWKGWAGWGESSKGLVLFFILGGDHVV